MTTSTYRKCTVCGKRKGTNYFGRLQIPTGKGKYKKVGESIMGPLGKVKIVKWTGKHKYIEYWECDRCEKEG